MSASRRSFASDNYSGAHPAVLEALAAANAGHCRAYGEDEITRRAEDLFVREFGKDCQVFFTATGTAANVLCLKAALAPHEAVVCAASSHLNTDECGAPEANAGCKLLLAPARDGKLELDGLPPLLGSGRGVHRVRAKLISISQTTELGTVYSLAEMRALSAFARAHDLVLHVDGARLSNAAAALGCSLADLTASSGADIVSFGGSKNGLMFGEAIVVFRPELAERLPHLRKQSMQLISKMRFVSAQFEAYLSGGLWRENAARANAVASYLARSLAEVAEVEITRPAEANAVFCRMPQRVIEPLQELHRFYLWDSAACEARLMCSFDSAESDVDAFVADLKRLLLA